MGLEVVFMPNALNGIADLEAHPEKRASDLKLAFKDITISAIILWMILSLKSLSELLLKFL